MGFEVNFKKIAEAFSNASKSGNLKIPEAKTAETSASAFEEQQTRLDNNFSSITAILNDDYGDETIRPKQENPWCRAIEENSSLEHMAAQYYEHKDDEELTQQEKNSFAWSLLDHNRWMIDDVNRTYLAQQVAQDLPDIQENEQDMVSDIVSMIVSGEEVDLDSYELSDEARANIEAVQTKYTNSEYDQFSADCRTDESTYGSIGLQTAACADTYDFKLAEVVVLLTRLEIDISQCVKFVHYDVYIVASDTGRHYSDTLALITAGNSTEFTALNFAFFIFKMRSNEGYAARVAHKDYFVCQPFRLYMQVENGTVFVDNQFGRRKILFHKRRCFF